MHEKDTPEFWREVTLKSVITVSDAQAVEDSMRLNKGAKGIDYIVKEIYKVEEYNRLCEWLFFVLAGEEDEIWLVVKIVDQEISLRIFFGSGRFPPASRYELIDRGFTWLFEEPEDPDDFRVNDLEYAKQIQQYIETGEGEKEFVFSQKAHGALAGICTCTPELSGIDELHAAVVEYFTDARIDNPELLILEMWEWVEAGSIEEVNPSEGLLYFLIGAEISFSEVDVLPH